MDIYVIHVLSREEVEPELVGDLRLVDCEDDDAAEITVSAPLLPALQGNPERLRRRSEGVVHAARDHLHLHDQSDPLRQTDPDLPARTRAGGSEPDDADPLRPCKSQNKYWFFVPSGLFARVPALHDVPQAQGREARFGLIRARTVTPLGAFHARQTDLEDGPMNSGWGGLSNPEFPRAVLQPPRRGGVGGLARRPRGDHRALFLEAAQAARAGPEHPALAAEHRGPARQQPLPASEAEPAAVPPASDPSSSR